MKAGKRLLVILLSLAMLATGSGWNVVKVKAAEETTKDSWVDPGNYTRGWFDSVTGLDTYGNTGAEEDPYEVKNAKDLAGLSYYSNITSTDSATTDFGGKYIAITAESIDLSAHYWYPIGAVQNFKGVVEGNGVTIQNMFIGSAAKYETCGRVGLFGSIHANVKNMEVKNAVIYSNSPHAGGFVGCWLGGNIDNCSVEGTMYHIASSSNAGGFAGYHATNSCTITNCYAKVPVVATPVTASNIGGFIGNTSAVTSYQKCYATGNVSAGTVNVGGFAGYNINGTFVDCYAKGNVNVTGGSNVGGFIGNSEIGTLKQCFATGNIVGVSSNSAGGFIGAIRYNNIYNCYSLGNVVAGDSSNVAGFIGLLWNHWEAYSSNYSLTYNHNASIYTCAMKIENCYCAGSTKAGSGSTVAGFFGGRQYDYSTVTFKKNYWNLTADQVLSGNYRINSAKTAVAYVGSRTTVGTYQKYMKSSAFAADLNEYVYQNSTAYNTWESDENVNSGFPYITGNRDVLFAVEGDDIEISTTDKSTDASMKVYGTLVFPEPPVTEQPEEPEDTSIMVGLKWGSLEYVYTAGKYDKETKSYADGTWAPKEAGVTDKISITNKSKSDIQATYSFIASTEGDGIYSSLSGEFKGQESQEAGKTPVIVSGKQGDILASQDVYLNVSGIPAVNKNIKTPEVIGRVVITIAKYVMQEETKPETTEAPEATETPAETEVPEATVTPAVTEVPEATETPAVTEVPEVTVTPEATETATPAASEEPKATVSEEPQYVTLTAPGSYTVTGKGTVVS